MKPHTAQRQFIAPILVNLPGIPHLSTLRGTKAVVGALRTALRKPDGSLDLSPFRPSGASRPCFRIPLLFHDASLLPTSRLLSRHLSHLRSRLQAGGHFVYGPHGARSWAFLQWALEHADDVPVRGQQPRVKAASLRAGMDAATLLKQVTDPALWMRGKRGGVQLTLPTGQTVPMNVVLGRYWQAFRGKLAGYGFRRPEEIPLSILSGERKGRGRHWIEMVYFAVHGQPALPKSCEYPAFPIELAILPDVKTLVGTQELIEAIVDATAFAPRGFDKIEPGIGAIFWTTYGELITFGEAIRFFYKAIVTARQAGGFPEAPVGNPDVVLHKRGFPSQAFRKWAGEYERREPKGIVVRGSNGTVFRRRIGEKRPAAPAPHPVPRPFIPTW